MEGVYRVGERDVRYEQKRNSNDAQEAKGTPVGVDDRVDRDVCLDNLKREARQESRQGCGGANKTARDTRRAKPRRDGKSKGEQENGRPERVEESHRVHALLAVDGFPFPDGGSRLGGKRRA